MLDSETPSTWTTQRSRRRAVVHGDVLVGSGRAPTGNGERPTETNSKQAPRSERERNLSVLKDSVRMPSSTEGVRSPQPSLTGAWSCLCRPNSWENDFRQSRCISNTAVATSALEGWRRCGRKGCIQRLGRVGLVRVHAPCAICVGSPAIGGPPNLLLHTAGCLHFAGRRSSYGRCCRRCRTRLYPITMPAGHLVRRQRRGGWQLGKPGRGLWQLPLDGHRLSCTTKPNKGRRGETGAANGAHATPAARGAPALKQTFCSQPI